MAAATVAVETSVKIYTDGGCSGNPGPGGWAYVVTLETLHEGKPQDSQIVAEQWGAEKHTTNNRMELTAVIESLKAFKSIDTINGNVLPRNAALYTDSQYVQKGITNWIHTWKRNSWRTSDKKPVKNKDLWMELDSLAGEMPLAWVWVRGHAGIDYNERCDRMTQEAIASLASFH